MGTINGCGTMFYGEDKHYSRSTTTKLVIEPQEASQRNSLIMKEILLKLSPRRKELLAKPVLSYRELEELKSIDLNIKELKLGLLPTNITSTIEIENTLNQDSYVATKWLVLFMLPIFPIESVLIHGYSPVTTTKGGRWRTTEYNTSEVPLHIKQVIKTYLLVYGVIALLLVIGYFL